MYHVAKALANLFSDVLTHTDDEARRPHLDDLPVVWHTAFLRVGGKVECSRYSFFAHLGYLFIQFGIAVGHSGYKFLFVGRIGHNCYLDVREGFLPFDKRKTIEKSDNHTCLPNS